MALFIRDIEGKLIRSEGISSLFIEPIPTTGQEGTQVEQKYVICATRSSLGRTVLGCELPRDEAQRLVERFALLISRQDEGVWGFDGNKLEPLGLRTD